jgi:prepilin-type processing-associated H-X9-DG protein
MDGDPKPLHFDGYNYLFADGHVKWLRPERTVGAGSPDWGGKKPQTAPTLHLNQ